MQKRKSVEKRNIVLKIETYERLEKYKIKLITERCTSQLSYDDVINSLLDREISNQRKQENTHI
jgi:hypothetical protein